MSLVCPTTIAITNGLKNHKKKQDDSSKLEWELDVLFAGYFAATHSQPKRHQTGM